MNTQKQRTA